MSMKQFCTKMKNVKLLMVKSFTTKKELRDFIETKFNSVNHMVIVKGSMILYNGSEYILLNQSFKNNRYCLELVGGIK